MALQEGLDLYRGDVLPADLKHVLGPAQKNEVSTLIDLAQVSGMEPPIGLDRFLGLLKIIVITREHCRATQKNFAGFIYGASVSGLRVANLNFTPRNSPSLRCQPIDQSVVGRRDCDRASRFR